MRKLHIFKFATMYLHVKEEYSLASILSIARNMRGVNLVDYSEEQRRIVLRIPLEDYSSFLMLIEKQASSIAIELKSVIKGSVCEALYSLIPHILREKEIQYKISILSKTDKSLITVIECPSEKNVLYLEVRRKKCLTKICKKPLIPVYSVTDFPPSLCLFDAKAENILTSLKSFNICLNALLRLSEDLALRLRDTDSQM